MTFPDYPVLGSAQAHLVAGPSDVTVVAGSSFCASDRAGDMVAARPQGFFYLDNRVISRWELTIDEGALQPLAVLTPEPFAATFLARAEPRPGQHESTLVVQRTRHVSEGLREEVVLRNFGNETVGCRVELKVDADFGDLFDVKDGRIAGEPATERRTGPGWMEMSVDHGGERRGVRVSAAGATAAPDSLSFVATVAPKGQWEVTIEVLPSIDGVELASPFPAGQPVAEAPVVQRLQLHRATAPVVHCDAARIEVAVERSIDDLGALRIVDPEHPADEIIAAGAPWFMALFGRDSLLTSWMSLPFDQSLVLGTLRSLARRQGTRVDPLSEEEPGKILHEVRRGVNARRALGGSHVYYGSVDSTPLFVMVLDAAARWGAPLAEVRDLLPAADLALAWVEEYGDSDGDGFVDYRRKTDRGLVNQGWKDSHDAMRFADGRYAEGPIAAAEVQAYVYGAYRARAHLAELLGDADAPRWEARADQLRASFNEAFWMAERGYLALALDGGGKQVDALASNMGHCLWTGILEEDKASDVVGHLMSPELFTGWGVRTLATSMRAYNPLSYHNGAVWPHDNALIVAGLARYGFRADAQRVAEALLDAASFFDGRLPELFCGFSRADAAAPIPYPASCSPQAWAAATPMSLLTSLLGLDPCIPHGQINADPVLPARWGMLTLEGLTAGTEVFSISAEGKTLVEAPALVARAR